MVSVGHEVRGEKGLVNADDGGCDGGRCIKVSPAANAIFGSNDGMDGVRLHYPAIAVSRGQRRTKWAYSCIPGVRTTMS
jgi:hypothetical protein